MFIHALRSPVLNLLIGCTLLTGCGGGSGDASGIVDNLTGPDYADLHPYVASGDYADVLATCAKVTDRANSCTFKTLPLIGMETTAPTTADIMARVLVSHDWMGRRFEQALNRLPPDIHLLLRATTVIVIDDDIRPAYYTTKTGAIYLDPAYLWLEPEELATINPKEDHRAGYSDPLQFRSLSRYSENGQHLYPHGLLDENPFKTLADVEFLLGRLLYHELAHANDFLPPASWPLLDRDSTVYQAIVNNQANSVSTQLYASEGPLISDQLYALADVMYWGDTPTEADLNITAFEVGALFEIDSASDHYAYASMFEDSAMLFEEAMMRFHFGIDRDIAFTTAPPNPLDCAGYIIGWGVRNRLGGTDVRTRAQFVVGEILPPSPEITLFFQNLSPPQPLPEGVSWCATLNINAPLRYGMQKTTPQTIPPSDLSRPHG